MTETEIPNFDILKNVLARLEGIKSYAEAYNRANSTVTSRNHFLIGLDHLERMDKVLEGIADHDGWDIPAIAAD